MSYYHKLLGVVLTLFFLSCQNKTPFEKEMLMPELKISLAQWSLHRQLNAGQIKPEDFPQIAKEKYSIDAVEYVNQFYQDHANDSNYWMELKEKTDALGVKNLLIMVDDEGDLGASNSVERQQAVENHKKWVDAAQILGCHSIRINAFGGDERNEFENALVDGLYKLCSYAATKNINILIENHGLFSSDADLMVKLIKRVNSDFLGTLPDFGNWCLSAKWGSTQIQCEKAYDRYEGVARFMPYAKGVSAKSYNFDGAGNDRIIDYKRMYKVVSKAGYNGYIGIEYEGEEVDEHHGILKTKALITRIWSEEISAQ